MGGVPTSLFENPGTPLLYREIRKGSTGPVIQVFSLRVLPEYPGVPRGPGEYRAGPVLKTGVGLDSRVPSPCVFGLGLRSREPIVGDSSRGRNGRTRNRSQVSRGRFRVPRLHLRGDRVGGCGLGGPSTSVTVHLLLGGSWVRQTDQLPRHPFPLWGAPSGVGGHPCLPSSRTRSR